MSTCRMIENPDECAICLESMDTSRVKQLECGHEFHQHCIDQWSQTQSMASCPLCRIAINQENCQREEVFYQLTVINFRGERSLVMWLSAFNIVMVCLSLASNHSAENRIRALAAICTHLYGFIGALKIWVCYLAIYIIFWTIQFFALFYNIANTQLDILQTTSFSTVLSFIGMYTVEIVLNICILVTITKLIVKIRAFRRRVQSLAQMQT